MSASVARVYWLDAPRQLRLAGEPLAEPKSGEVGVRTLVSAVSPGTELAAWRGAPPLRPGTGYPRLLGYCNVGVVAALGTGVTSLEPGDRVLTHASHRSGFTVGQAGVLARLPEGLAADVASLAYLFNLGYDAVIRGGVTVGSRVAVIGGGVLGLTSTAMAALAGGEVTLITAHTDAAAIGKRFGAVATVTRDQVRERPGSDETAADVVISTTGSWNDWRLALDSTVHGGTIAVLGFPGREEAGIPFNPLDSARFYHRQLTVRAVGMAPEYNDSRRNLPFNERDNLTRILRWLDEGRLDASPLIIERRPADELASAYASLESRSQAGTVVLDWA